MPKARREDRLEKIKAAIESGDASALSDTERKDMLAIQVVGGMLMGGRGDESIHRVLKREHDLSWYQAQQRIRDCRYVFDDLFIEDKAFERQRLYLRAEKAYTIAEANEDVEGMVKATKLMAEIKGIDKMDNAAIDPTLLEPSTIQLKLPPDVLKLVRAAQGNGIIDLNKLGNVRDAKFSVVEDAEEEEESLTPSPSPVERGDRKRLNS
jgi:hypothetical protein